MASNQIQYCPFCGDVLTQRSGSRFLLCGRHERVVVNAAIIDGDEL